MDRPIERRYICRINFQLLKMMARTSTQSAIKKGRKKKRQTIHVLSWIIQCTWFYALTLANAIDRAVAFCAARFSTAHRIKLVKQFAARDVEYSCGVESTMRNENRVLLDRHITFNQLVITMTDRPWYRSIACLMHGCCRERCSILLRDLFFTRVSVIRMLHVTMF